MQKKSTTTVSKVKFSEKLELVGDQEEFKTEVMAGCLNLRGGHINLTLVLSAKCTALKSSD